MPTRRITPRESGFRYNPKVDEVRLFSDLVFCLNPVTKVFELDQNPHGEPMLTEVEPIEASEHLSSVSFTANYRDEVVDFEVSTANGCDAAIFRLIDEVNRGQRMPAFNPEDPDKVEVVFEEGQLAHIYLYKYQAYELVDSLTVVREDEALYLITQGPWKKTRLESVAFADGSLICTSAEDTLVYPVDVNDFIQGVIDALMAQI